MSDKVTRAGSGAEDQKPRAKEPARKESTTNPIRRTRGDYVAGAEGTQVVHPTPAEPAEPTAATPPTRGPDAEE
jgi:hypothetical protein